MKTIENCTFLLELTYNQWKWLLKISSLKQFLITDLMLWFHFPHEDNVKKMYFNQFISCEISIKSSQCKESGLVIYCGEFFIGCVLVDNLIILMSDERPYWVAWQVLNMRYCSPWSIIITTSIYECWTMLQTTHQTLSTPNIIVQLTTLRNEIYLLK